jgi:hypothetical protein
VRLEPPDARLPGRRLAAVPGRRRVTWPAGLGLGRLMASAWLEDRSTTPARSTRMPARARRPAETAFGVRTRPAARAPVPTRVLRGRAQSARSVPPDPVRLAAADRMARAGPSPRVRPPAGARLIRSVLPVARWPRRRAWEAQARGATVAAWVAPAGPVAPVVPAGPAATGAGVGPAVPADPMARGAPPSPALPEVVVGRMIRSAAGARSAA